MIKCFLFTDNLCFVKVWCGKRERKNSFNVVKCLVLNNYVWKLKPFMTMVLMQHIQIFRVTISKWHSMDFRICWNALSMFQNAFQMFSNDFEMVFNEYFFSLKCVVNVPKCIDNVFKMHYQRLKMHWNGNMVQRSFPLRVVFANRVTIEGLDA